MSGLFYEQAPDAKPKRAMKRWGPMPMIPDNGWRPPEFPNLSAAKVLGFDLETYDPELIDAGPGWGRGKGHIIGASLSVEDGTSWYFPMRHGYDSEGNGAPLLPPEHMAMNMDPYQVTRFLTDVLDTNRPKVGANLIYDAGWAAWEGVKISGRLYDVQFAEALLNSEEPDVTLDSLALRYLGIGKTTETLYEWLSRWNGLPVNGKQRAHLYKTPPCLAGPYAEDDAALPIKIMEKQWPLLAERGVLELFDIECRLIPLLVKMRLKGASVDVNRAEETYDELGSVLAGFAEELKHIAGIEVNPNARESLERAFKAVGIPEPTTIDTKTKQRKVSYAADVLESIEHPLTDKILEYKKTEKVRNTFVQNYIMKKHVNGKLYCSFHPLKGEGGGTRSGRFASSSPNLQNIPARTEIGKSVRKLFTSGGTWVKADYSQIEYRMLAHHAVGPGSLELRQAYADNPDIDYHDLTAQLVMKLTGIELPRRNIKNINFGLIYGMSELKLATGLGLDKEGGNNLFKSYHEAAPFAKATMDDASEEAKQFGYVRTLLGRKSDFNHWSPIEYSEDRAALPYEKACQKWGIYNIQRAFLHKALNRRLQGGAADVMKLATLNAYEAGLFEENECGMPSLTVHDELDWDEVDNFGSAAWDRFQDVMENSIPGLKVPVRIDIGAGKNWGDAD